MRNAFLRNMKKSIIFVKKTRAMNPFSYGNIVKGKHFYDRKDECERIVQTLSGGNNLVLYAPRRFGKTSLVFKAMEQLDKMGFTCIYFDFMPVFSEESFVRLYTKAISEKQRNLERFTQQFTSAVKKIRPVLSFDHLGNPEISIDFANGTIDETVISQVLDLPEELAEKNKRILIFFDEFQEIERFDKINFEGLLRSKIQQQNNINYLFFGSKTHLIKQMFNSKKRAFYNAASQMSIGRLPIPDTIDFLKKNFAQSGMDIDMETANYLIDTAGNIPHYIQLLAAECWQYLVATQTEITREVIDICASHILVLKYDYYMEVYEHLSQSQRQLLKALTVSGKNIFSINYIKEHRLPAPSTLQRAVKGLINNGVIEKVKTEYFIADPFFYRFVSEN